MSKKFYKNKKLSIINGPMTLTEGETVNFTIVMSKASLFNDLSAVTLNKIGILTSVKLYNDNNLRITFKTEGLVFYGIYNPNTLKGKFLKVE